MWKWWPPSGNNGSFPVFIPRANLVVSWSPRAGCSHAVLWAFLQEGLFEEANARNAWPHVYRTEVYNRSAVYRRMQRDLARRNGAGSTLLRITRYPANRLVSIFRHVCRYPILREPARKALGIDCVESGLSLTDLDAVLGGLRLAPPTRANPHVRTQWSPLWDLGFDRIITLNLDEVPLDASLNAVEADLGLPRTDFGAVPEFQRLRKVHYTRPRRFLGPHPIETTRFRREDTQPFPKVALISSPLLKSMAVRHYQIDGERVGAGDTAGLLFQPDDGTGTAQPKRLVPGELG